MYNHHVQQAFGKYHIIKLLGVGGFAQVYLAEDNGSQVAIKVLNAPTIDESDMQLFINEAQKLSELQHPHIVKVLDFSVKGNIPYLVMEYAPNGTLAQKHRDKSPLSYPTIITYVNQVASALQYVHDRNLVHCDVKPANLLLGKNNEVILGDFGIVTATRTTAAPTMDHIRGTAPYMAPELSAGRPVRASDQYSLAVIIYEWLCGQLPFQGSPDAIYRQHQMDEPPPLRRKDNGASIQLQITRVVLKALEKDPKRRYTTVQEFAHALEKALQPILAPPRPTLPFSSSNQSPLVIASPENQAAPNDLTVASSSPFLPIPSTPPTLPVDALIQRQQEFLQNFQAIQGEHEQKKSELEQEQQEKMDAAIQSLILRLLATQPSGKIQFVFVDPDKLGGTVSAFFNNQTDADTILGTGRALIHTQDIKQQLRKLIDHIAHLNPADGLIETQYVLLVMDFPANFTQEAAEDLLRIARNGPLAGVSTILVVDTSDPTRSLTKFDPHLQALEKGAILITWDEANQQFSWQDSPLQGGQLRLDEVPSIDAPPPQDLFKRILRELSREAQTSTSVESLFSSREVQARTNRGKIWLGQSLTNKEPASLTFRRQSNKNLLLVGTDEAAAQDMLILSMLFQSVYYSPQQAQFYVVDLRVEDTFEENLTKKFEKNAFEVVTQLLPAYFSRPSVTLPTMRSDLPRLLTAMSDELADREDGKITIASPSRYLFIHGLQFAGKILQKGYANNDSAVFRDAAEKFSHILHNGSRMGIHTLIWSDQFSSLETSPGNDILRCFDYRVALHRSSKEDVTKLLEGLDTFPPGQQQASFFSRDREKVEKFHPYNIPSQAWLETIMKRFQP